MEFIVGFFVVVFIILIIVNIAVKSTANRTRHLANHPIPEELGIRVDKGDLIVESLNDALSNSYVENVKNRVLRENPTWLDHEYEWTFFELKRYFVLNSLLKTVPMFSTKVDEIWHEMLMFTREYEKFSNDFFKATLHHTPNMDSSPLPGERALFDWVYLSLFKATSNSRAIWGGFMQFPLNRELLNDFRELSEGDLLVKYFRNNDDWIEIKKYLINKLKSEIKHADDSKHKQDKLDVPTTAGQPEYYHLALGAAVYYSLYDEETYQEQMREVVPDEFQKSFQGGGSSCSSGFGCSSSNDDSSGSSGDSGGSSCSSCSSCGGGS